MKLKNVPKFLALAALGLCLSRTAPPTSAQTAVAPDIVGLSRPVAGQMQLVFHGNNGPYRIQTKTSGDPAAAWFDVTAAKVTEIQPGVYLALLPIIPQDDLGFYRVVNENETIAELKGWTYLVQVSKPANDSFFVAGESPVITVTILDNFAQGITRDSFSGLNLYLHGPEDPRLTKTAVKLLNASTDRSARPHHYIDLKTNADVEVTDNVLTYTLKPITDEDPGTYTVTVYATRGDDPIQQIMKFASLQIGTATVETMVTSSAKCADCHQGTVSGKMYMHHADVGRSPVGSWAIDLDPEKSCKACHNNDGYASFTDPLGPDGRRSDHIVIRAHGVHMGEGLSSDFNTNSVSGNFADYLHVAFPADIRNCTSCHVDDRWKTRASRLACGSCHDNTWFGAVASMPAGMVAHPAGPQSTDEICGACHAPDNGTVTDSIADNHRITPPDFLYTVTLAMSAPANGTFFAAGETPTVSLRVIDKATGQPIDPASIVEPAISTNIQPNEWRTAELYVYGPRSLAVPALTTAAALETTTDSRARNDIRVRVDPANNDPAVTRTATDIQYQLSDVADLPPGTYLAYAEVRPASGLGGTGFVEFQVGNGIVEPSITPEAACLSCHADTRIHGSRNLTMSPELCKQCHDYKHQLAGFSGWNTSQGGFGVLPLSRRIHQLHFGRYLHNQTDARRGEFEEIIFPQDVRNCTKCHSEPANMSWNEKPGRLACLACHDKQSAVVHASLQTWDPTPEDPWSGDEVETCDVCHGANAADSAMKVHSIANPYVPPYPREPAE